MDLALYSALYVLFMMVLISAYIINRNLRRNLYVFVSIGVILLGILTLQAYHANQKAHTLNFQQAYYQSLYRVVKQLSTAQKQHYNLAAVKKRIRYRLNQSQMQHLNHDLKVHQTIANKAFIDWNHLDTVKSTVQSNIFNTDATYLNIPTALNHTYPIYWNVQDMNLFASVLDRQYLYQDGLRHNIDNLKAFKYAHYNDYHLQQRMIKKYERS